jgi:hypothetical protein
MRDDFPVRAALVNKHLQMWQRKSPFATVIGSCDQVSNDLAKGYFDAAKGANEVRIHQLMVHGANHNFFNTQWSPASGQVTAEDDAHQPGEPFGHCRTTDASHVDEAQLTEDQQRRVGTAYISAFFRRYLTGDTSVDPMLTRSAPGVDAEFADPAHS